MTDIQLCDNLLDYLDINCPATMDAPQSFTVVSASGNILQISTLGGTPNQWVGGLAEVTTGAAIDEKFVIAQSTPGSTGTLIIAGGFNPHKLPGVGDTVKLSGGPLQSARKYLFEPTTILQDVAAGKKFFVVASCLDGSVEPASMGGGRSPNLGIFSAKRQFKIQIEATTPIVTGMPTAADAYRIAVQLPMLKEQIMVIAYWFRLQAANKVSGSGPIEFTYGVLQRTGGPAFNAAIIEFDVAVSS